MIAIEEGREDRYLTISCEAGSFCRNCPTVVLDTDMIEDLISIDAELFQDLLESFAYQGVRKFATCLRHCGQPERPPIEYGPKVVIPNRV